MVNFALGIILLLGQLTGPGASLPQVMAPSYSTDAIPQKGGDVEVTFDVRDGFVINRIPPIQLKLEAVEGLTLSNTDFVSPSEDPKSTDEYYVDVPGFEVGVRASRAGQYEIPGRLIYFFCSKADGFCSRQVVEVKVPVQVE